MRTRSSPDHNIGNWPDIPGVFFSYSLRSKVVVLTPSWADEFITPLMKNFGGKVKLKKTSNPSVKAVLKIINQ